MPKITRDVATYLLRTMTPQAVQEKIGDYYAAEILPYDDALFAMVSADMDPVAAIEYLKLLDIELLSTDVERDQRACEVRIAERIEQSEKAIGR